MHGRASSTTTKPAPQERAPASAGQAGGTRERGPSRDEQTAHRRGDEGHDRDPADDHIFLVIRPLGR
jgi:hypothetical protein